MIVIRLVNAREQRALETKAHFYEVTKNILETYGLKFLTIRNICEEAEVTHGAFYYHFKSKENILFEYGVEAFTGFLAKNPPPDTFDHRNFIKLLMWPLIVYARFCEIMSWEFMKFLCDNCDDDVFSVVCFEELKRGVIMAISDGYMAPQPDDFLQIIIEDIQLTYTGTARQWICSEKTRSGGGSLAESLWRLTHKFIRSFATDKFIAEFGYPTPPTAKNTYISAFGIERYDFNVDIGGNHDV